MTKRFSLAEARKSLPGILDRVEAGSDVELTRRGKPVAVLVSTREYQRLHTERPAFGEAFRRFLARHRLPSPGSCAASSLMATSAPSPLPSGTS